ncbi:hypothetical protein [Oceanicaulis sp.]|uniref:hypothetical protein n=1 Tax=Oceanicaulis sp. TaxID=1924941 RepID=UPI003F70662E
MRIETVYEDERLVDEIASLVRLPVEAALQSVVTSGNEFIVNPTLWYAKNQLGRPKPAVVNSAKYISRAFQEDLKAQGWSIEKTLGGQTIDAYTEISPDFDVTLFSLREDRFISVLSELKDRGEATYGLKASEIFRDFVTREAFYMPAFLNTVRERFEVKSGRPRVRVGLEFETGNIASSFRAIQKLQFLSVSDEIDVGVFITSLNKRDCSTRIWPVSNRNGSFEELFARRYDQLRSHLALDIGFAPDGFSDEAPYLGEDGKLFTIEEVGATEIEGTVYIEGRTSAGRTFFRHP